MKTAGIILCNVAIALGILVGRRDYEAEVDAARQEALARAANLPPAPPAVAPRREPGRSASSRESGRGERSHEPVPGDDFLTPAEPRAGSLEARGSGASDSDLGAPPDPLEAAPRFRVRLEKLAELIAAQDFDAAEAAARALAAETDGGPDLVRDAALRLAAKARAFRKVVAQLPKETPSAPAPVAAKVSEVLLSSGVKITALKADEEADRWVLLLEGGVTFAPRKEDVLQVRTLEKTVSLAPGWPALQQKLAKLEDPVLLFVDGVERCYRMGLRREGLGVLERALARPDSDQIPLLFVREADEALLGDWQVAAGRRPPGGAASALAQEDSGPGSRRPGALASSGAPEEEEDAEADAATLARVAKLLGEAQALYQSSAGKEGREADLKTARERLEKALGIAEALADGSPEARKLRRQLAQLLSDVARASPF